MGSVLRGSVSAWAGVHVVRPDQDPGADVQVRRSAVTDHQVRVEGGDSDWCAAAMQEVLRLRLLRAQAKGNEGAVDDHLIDQPHQ